MYALSKFNRIGYSNLQLISVFLFDFFLYHSYVYNLYYVCTPKAYTPNAYRNYCTLPCETLFYSNVFFKSEAYIWIVYFTPNATCYGGNALVSLSYVCFLLLLLFFVSSFVLTLSVLQTYDVHILLAYNLAALFKPLTLWFSFLPFRFYRQCDCCVNMLLFPMPSKTPSATSRKRSFFSHSMATSYKQCSCKHPQWRERERERKESGNKGDPITFHQLLLSSCDSFCLSSRTVLSWFSVKKKKKEFIIVFIFYFKYIAPCDIFLFYVCLFVWILCICVCACSTTLMYTQSIRSNYEIVHNSLSDKSIHVFDMLSKSGAILKEINMNSVRVFF